jgi:hypothetical protein
MAEYRRLRQKGWRPKQAAAVAAGGMAIGAEDAASASAPFDAGQVEIALTQTQTAREDQSFRFANAPRGIGDRQQIH